MSLLSYIEPVGMALGAVSKAIASRKPREVTVLTQPMGFGQALEGALGKGYEGVANALSLNDLNGDGALSFEESGMTDKTFARLDLNGDGKLDKLELLQAFLEQNSTFQDAPKLNAGGPQS